MFLILLRLRPVPLPSKLRPKRELKLPSVIIKPRKYSKGGIVDNDDTDERTDHPVNRPKQPLKRIERVIKPKLTVIRQAEPNRKLGSFDLDLDGYLSAEELDNVKAYNMNTEFGRNLFNSFSTALGESPLGYVWSAKDAYEAIKDNDWVNATLAAFGTLPFVPSGIKYALKAAHRFVPMMERSNIQQMINRARQNVHDKIEYIMDVTDARNRLLESLNSHPYRYRATVADNRYGTNYNETYDLLNQLYESNYFALPEVKPKYMESTGRMQAKPAAIERYEKSGVGAGPTDFDFYVNPDDLLNPELLANHEMNHYTDYVISRNPDTTNNNNMLKLLEKSLKDTGDTYFRSGTELKSYMNQLRLQMLLEGMIQDITLEVPSKILESYIRKLPESNAIRQAFNQHKDAKSYARWFNTIPLLTIAPVVVNHDLE